MYLRRLKKKKKKKILLWNFTEHTQRDRSRDGALGTMHVMSVVCFYFVSVSLPHTAVYSMWATAV